MLVNTKFANIINIAARLTELLRSKCNPKNIFEYVSKYLDNPEKIEKQVKNTQLILNNFKTKYSPSKLTAESINKFYDHIYSW